MHKDVSYELIINMKEENGKNTLKSKMSRMKKRKMNSKNEVRLKKKKIVMKNLYNISNKSKKILSYSKKMECKQIKKGRKIEDIKSIVLNSLFRPNSFYKINPTPKRSTPLDVTNGSINNMICGYNYAKINENNQIKQNDSLSFISDKSDTVQSKRQAFLTDLKDIKYISQNLCQFHANSMNNYDNLNQISFSHNAIKTNLTKSKVLGRRKLRYLNEKYGISANRHLNANEPIDMNEKAIHPNAKKCIKLNSFIRQKMQNSPQNCNDPEINEYRHWLKSNSSTSLFYQNSILNVSATQFSSSNKCSIQNKDLQYTIKQQCDISYLHPSQFQPTGNYDFINYNDYL
ncbi:hypothetical protein A3Q56_08043 [Intoshia linei]|uniref:Uncharacterized protein n=1 Tax=Intoshia linei TaxID=1819745 RepID=A0A177AS86_9BILA|nr:hypothetical protein A3Q56_08043 [Intoshia linei]